MKLDFSALFGFQIKNSTMSDILKKKIKEAINKLDNIDGDFNINHSSNDR